MNSLEQDDPATYLVGQGKGHPDHAAQRPLLGNPVRFQVWLRRGLLRPAWVALCGALASGGLALQAEPLLQLALLWRLLLQRRELLLLPLRLLQPLL